jgi:DNA-damage-inducible protein J
MPKAKTVVVQARIQPDLKDDTDQIFDKIGISRSEAIKVFLQQVRLHQGFPFALKVPNDNLVQTFKDTEAGKNRHQFDSPQELFNDLGL